MFVWSLTLCTRNVDIIFFIKANKRSSSTYISIYEKPEMDDSWGQSKVIFAPSKYFV